MTTTTETRAPEGVNIAGDGVTLGAEYVRDRKAFIYKNRMHYANTPVTPPDNVPRGQYRHIGGGLWLKRCRECDDYIVSYGAVQYYREFAEHEHKTHGLDVVGYNVAMLPH